MKDDHSPPTSPPERSPPTEGLPWGQLAIGGIGLSLCLSSFATILQLFRLPGVEAVQTFGGVPLFGGLICGVVATWRSQFGKQKGQRLPRKEWLHTMNVAIWAIVIAGILLTIMVPAFYAGFKAARDAERDDPTKADSSGDVTSIATPDGRHVLNVPAGWHDISSTVAPNVWQIAQADPSEQMGATAGIFAREDLTAHSFQEYAQVCLAQFPKEFEQFDVLETTTSSTANRSMQQVLVAAAKDGVRITMLLQFIETPQSYIQLRVWGLPSAFRQHEPLLRSVLASFRETGIPPAPPAD